MMLLLQHRLVTVSLDEQGRVVHLVRTAVAGTAAEVSAAFGDAERAVSHLPLARYGLLCDVRPAPGNNDPSFETGIAPARARLFARFARVATLVKSATGLLQVQRLALDAGEHGLVFRDEPAALRYLRTGET